jgi:hypothetical protein
VLIKRKGRAAAQPRIAFAIVPKGFKDGAADWRAGLGVAMFFIAASHASGLRWDLLYEAFPPLTKLARKRTVFPQELPPCAAAFACRTLISGRASLLCASAAIVAQAAIILLTSEGASQCA